MFENDFYKITYIVNNKKCEYLRESKKVYYSLKEISENLKKYKNIYSIKKYLICDIYRPFLTIKNVYNYFKKFNKLNIIYYTFTNKGLFVDTFNEKQIKEIEKRIKKNHDVIIQDYIKEKENNYYIQIDYKYINDFF